MSPNEQFMRGFQYELEKAATLKRKLLAGVAALGLHAGGAVGGQQLWKGHLGQVRHQRMIESPLYRRIAAENPLKPGVDPKVWKSDTMKVYENRKTLGTIGRATETMGRGSKGLDKPIEAGRVSIDKAQVSARPPIATGKR